MSVVYLYYLSTTCLPACHHNYFMATGATGCTNVQLHVAGVQESKECSSGH